MDKNMKKPKFEIKEPYITILAIISVIVALWFVEKIANSGC